MKYEQLLETIGWFFFDIFILGYAEDPVTGNSFRFPGGMSWAIYVEVNVVKLRPVLQHDLHLNPLPG